jgi:PAS domain S-box-containing protein
VLILSEDITETKQVSDALKVSEARYRRIVETAQEGICTVDAVGYITYVNPLMAGMLGYTPDELLGRSALDFVDARTGTEMMEFVLRRQDGFDGTRDVRVRRKDGHDVWVNISLTPIIEPDGLLRGVLIMATNVTKRKEAERQLERQRAFYAAGAEIVTEPIFAVSPERIVIWQNRALEAFAARHALDMRVPPVLCDAVTGSEIPLDCWPEARALRGETVSPCPYLLRVGERAVRVMGSAAPVIFEGEIIAAVVVMNDRV